MYNSRENKGNVYLIEMNYSQQNSEIRRKIENDKNLKDYWREWQSEFGCTTTLYAILKS